MPTARPLPAAIYLLADHLDAMLAAGEDLMGVMHAPPAAAATADRDDALIACLARRATVERIRTLELAVVARTLKAREHCAQLLKFDATFKPVASLFIGGTALLVDAVADCADATQADFDHGDGLLAYLRSRQLVAGDATCFADDEKMSVCGQMLLMRRVPLAGLLDVVAAFLDALDARFDLYRQDEPADAGPPVAEIEPAEIIVTPT